MIADDHLVAAITAADLRPASRRGSFLGDHRSRACGARRLASDLTEKRLDHLTA